MPNRVATDGPYFRVWFSGVLTAADLREVAEAFRALELRMGRVPDRLVDMSDVVATGATFEIAIIAARIRAAEQFPNPFRSALVAPRIEVAGFARIFRILNRNPQIEIQVFDRVEDAEAWLES